MAEPLGIEAIVASRPIQQYPLCSLGGSIVAGVAVGGWLAGHSYFHSHAARPRRSPREGQATLGRVFFWQMVTQSLGKIVKQAAPLVSVQFDQALGRLASRTGSVQSAKVWAPAATNSPTP